MRRHRLCALTLFVLTLTATVAIADDQQTPPAGAAARPQVTLPALPARVFIDANGAYQSRTLSFSDTRTDPSFGETRSWTADYAVGEGPAFDVSGGVRLWRGLLARVTYSRFTNTRAATIVGEVPHPFFFDRARDFSGESRSLKQVEDAVHVSAAWVAPLHDRVDVMLFGGPTMFRLKRDLIEDVTLDDPYPFDTATLDGATLKTVNEDAIGFHAGADVTYYLTDAIGVGAIVRYTSARVDVASPATGGTLGLDLGGFQAGGGLRIRIGRRAATTVYTGPRPERRSTQPEPSRAEATPGTPAASPRTAARTIVAAPVFVAPDAARVPLATLDRGTVLRVLESSGDWLRVEFSDRRWGTRVGWIQRKHCDW